MSERIAEATAGDEHGSEWDEMPSYEDVRAAEVAESTETIKSLGAEFRKLERAFADGWPEAQSKYPDDAGKQAAYEDFYVKKYEGWLRHNRFLAKINARTAEITNPYYLASCEGIAVPDPAKSIEVASARFFDERMKELRAVATPEETQVLDGTFAKVAEHMSYEYMPRSQVTETYDANRTAAHNRVIEQLNKMNDIATAHELTPFTVRNFQSSAGYRSGGDPNGDYGRQLRSDRAIVARYFDTALAKQVEPLKEKLEREKRFEF